MKSKVFELVLTAMEPISHHDPATGNDSNTLTLNRQKQFVARKPQDTPVMQHLIDHLCEHNQMPDTISDLASRFTLPEWVAVAYIRLFLDVYNHGEGEGLLSGMERYRMLENRLQTSAARCHTLHKLWAILSKDLLLGTHAAKWDNEIALFWSLPPSVQYQVLQIMTEQYRMVTTLARVWHTANKEQNEEYADKSGNIFNPEPWRTPHFDVSGMPDAVPEIVLEVPAISVNSLRHQLVREPAFMHLCDALGIKPSARGEGEFPIHAESIFYNGGNIKAGATQPRNAFFLAGEIRKAYPSLDLLGGTTASFDLGESKLKVSAWVVCQENKDALPESLRNTPQANTSVFDMLDNVTRTRQATPNGEGQMIYNYEVLVKGTQIYVELTLTPYTGNMTEGALSTAIDYYQLNDNVVGGQSARGHGHVSLDWISDKPGHAESYNEYLESEHDKLLGGITDGTLCSGKKRVV